MELLSEPCQGFTCSSWSTPLTFQSPPLLLGKHWRALGERLSFSLARATEVRITRDGDVRSEDLRREASLQIAAARRSVLSPVECLQVRHHPALPTPAKLLVSVRDDGSYVKNSRRPLSSVPPASLATFILRLHLLFLSFNKSPPHHYSCLTSHCCHTNEWS